MDTATFVQNAAEQTGFTRIKYDESLLPTSFDNITPILFFGNIRSQFILSTLLLKNYIESRPSRYFILCSWPDSEHLYPYIKEYWSIPREEAAKIERETVGFGSKAELAGNFERFLRRHFSEVVTFEDLKQYYNNGFTDAYFEKFGKITYNLPMISSLSPEVSRQFMKFNVPKIFIHPAIRFSTWSFKETPMVIPKDFWHNFIQFLLDEGYMPVIYQNFSTYDFSTDFDSSKCIYLHDCSISEVLSGMRASDCVVDFFSGMYKLALVARCPYVNIVDRKCYNNLKDNEIDGICMKNLPRETIFSVADAVGDPNANYKQVLARVKLLSEVEDDLPSAGVVSEVLDYEEVKEFRRRKLGTRLFKVDRI